MNKRLLVILILNSVTSITNADDVLLASTVAIYFAADVPPTENAPSEAPLCYKFQVASLEEQLDKLKVKYPNLHDEKIIKNADNSRSLIAKRNDESSKEINYFYSSSPTICNQYQEKRLGITVQSSSTSKLTFEQFPVMQIYRGPTVLPQFNGRDKKYRDYRTRITNGMNEGVKFSGEYSVIQFGCGTQCTFVFIANNKTGQVFNFPRGGEDNLELNLSFKPTSRLLIARWNDTESCILEYFEWINNEAKLLKSGKIGNADECSSS